VWLSGQARRSCCCWPPVKNLAAPLSAREAMLEGMAPSTCTTDSHSHVNTQIRKHHSGGPGSHMDTGTTVDTDASSTASHHNDALSCLSATSRKAVSGEFILSVGHVS
jgi:hypothetical protein